MLLYMYNLLDPVCIKINWWPELHVSFVFPDRIQIPKTPQLAYSTFRPCTPSSHPIFSLNLRESRPVAEITKDRF